MHTHVNVRQALLVRHAKRMWMNAPPTRVATEVHARILSVPLHAPVHQDIRELCVKRTLTNAAASHVKMEVPVLPVHPETGSHVNVPRISGELYVKRMWTLVRHNLVNMEGHVLTASIRLRALADPDFSGRFAKHLSTNAPAIHA